MKHGQNYAWNVDNRNQRRKFGARISFFGFVKVSVDRIGFVCLLITNSRRLRHTKANRVSGAWHDSQRSNQSKIGSSESTKIVFVVFIVVVSLGGSLVVGRKFHLFGRGGM